LLGNTAVVCSASWGVRACMHPVESTQWGAEVAVALVVIGVEAELAKIGEWGWSAWCPAESTEEGLGC
jgi:hypothetical protein